MLKKRIPDERGCGVRGFFKIFIWLIIYKSFPSDAVTDTLYDMLERERTIFKC